MPRLANAKDYQRKLGRPVTTNITPHLMMVNEYPDEWIAEDYTEAQATSARRQFKNLGGYVVMTSKSEIPGHRVVLVRKAPPTPRRTA